ncbi:MAG: hypothetical protein LUC49_06800 [Prevotella sp.]|nr:hypothetical protein [Prevotella sp.]
MKQNHNDEGEVRTPGTPVSPYEPDIVWDLDGYPMNAKYPPDVERYGSSFHGYPTDERETIFYHFAVQSYDLTFKYKGKTYYAVSDVDHVALCDEHFTKEYEVYPNANAFIENFKIDGRPLIELIDELEDVEPV